MILEITGGIAGTGIKAGIIGELASADHRIARANSCVPSLDPESTITTSVAQPTVARQSAMFRLSLSVGIRTEIIAQVSVFRWDGASVGRCFGRTVLR